MMRLYLCVLTISILAFLASATVLGDLARSMSPGTWAELNCTGFTKSLLDGGGGHHIFEYTDDAVWDPVTEQVLFLGGAHGGNQKFISYNAETNTWRMEPLPSWAINQVGHAYDHNAIDQQNGIMYHHSMDGRDTRRYVISTGSISILSRPKGG